jgi:hypothetical protein
VIENIFKGKADVDECRTGVLGWTFHPINL